jgi:hypothetical protein
MLRVRTISACVNSTFSSSLFGRNQVVQFFIGLNGSYLIEANTVAFFNLIHSTLPRSSTKTWGLGACFQSREIATVDEIFLWKTVDVSCIPNGSKEKIPA